jgi:MFS family permease
MGGTFLQNIALAWLVLELTNSGRTVGIVAAAQFLPPLLFGAWAGTVADRVDNRKAVLALQVLLGAQATALAVLVFTHRIALWSIIALALVQGFAAAFDPPVRQGLMTELVGDDEITSAIATNSALAHFGGIVGPMLAALLISTVGTSWCFAVNAVSYVLMFWAIHSIRPSEMVRRAKAPQGPGALRAGFGYIRSRPDVLVLLALLGIASLFASRIDVIIPLLATTGLRGGSTMFSTMSVARGLGALTSSVYVAGRRRPPTLGLVRAAGLGMAGSLILAAIPFEPLALRRVIVVIALYGVGAGMMLSIVVTLTMTQLLVDPSYRGRAVAIWFLVMNAGTVVGSPLTGWVSERFGTSTALTLGSVSMVLVFAVATRAIHSQQRR